MTIGLTFPIKDHETIESVPWSVVEAHRTAIAAKLGLSPERLHAQGGLTLGELADVTGIDASVLEKAHGPKEPPPVPTEATE
jgi:hypothetical protein